MRIILSVTEESTPGQTTECRTVLDVSTIDDPTVNRLLNILRGCESKLRGTCQATAGSTEPGNHSQQSASGNGKRLATEKQINAIRLMADRQEIDLGVMLQDHFGVSGLSALTIGQASTLIDQLKGKLASV